MTNEITITHTGETRGQFYATARIDGEGRYGFVSATYWGAETAELAEAGARERLEHERVLEQRRIVKVRQDHQHIETFGWVARRLASQQSTASKGDKPTDAQPGAAVWVWGFGQWRHGVVVEISKTGKVARVLYYTPSNMVPHLTKTNEFYR